MDVVAFLIFGLPSFLAFFHPDFSMSISLFADGMTGFDKGWMKTGAVDVGGWTTRDAEGGMTTGCGLMIILLFIFCFDREISLFRSVIAFILLLVAMACSRRALSRTR
jgi:hypothetical protein